MPGFSSRLRTSCGTQGQGIMTLIEFAEPSRIERRAPTFESCDIPASSTCRMTARVPAGKPSFSA